MGDANRCSNKVTACSNHWWIGRDSTSNVLLKEEKPIILKKTKSETYSTRYLADAAKQTDSWSIMDEDAWLRGSETYKIYYWLQTKVPTHIEALFRQASTRPMTWLFESNLDLLILTEVFHFRRVQNTLFQRITAQLRVSIIESSDSKLSVEGNATCNQGTKTSSTNLLQTFKNLSTCSSEMLADLWERKRGVISDNDLL